MARFIWTLEKCKENALQYQTRGAWYNGNSSAYVAARRNGWAELCCKHMHCAQAPVGFWTLERCMESAKRYDTRTEWCVNDHKAYDRAQYNDWVDLCCAHMEPIRQSHTLEKCKRSAMQYSSRSEWYLKDMDAYLAAHRNNWLEVCCGHMIELKKPKGYWTLERCKEDALCYSTRVEWRIASNAAAYAYNNGWLEECCKHMKRALSTSLPERNLFDLIKDTFPKTQSIRMKTKDFIINMPHIHRFELDIYIPELRKAIEFNGTYWHSIAGLKRGRLRYGWPLEDIQNYHQLKRQFFADKGIGYIEIQEADWTSNQQQCIERCLNFLSQPEVING